MLLLRGLVRAYQGLVRPWLPPACRYQPSCSEYALEALRLHGPLRGSWLATARICRCHPFRAGGFDPVPLPASASSSAATAGPACSGEGGDAGKHLVEPGAGAATVHGRGPGPGARSGA